MAHDPQRQARAQARRERLARRIAAGAHTGGLVRSDTPPRGATVQERLQMVLESSIRGHLLSGGTLPTYARHEMPGRVIRTCDE